MSQKIGSVFLGFGFGVIFTSILTGFSGFYSFFGFPSGTFFSIIGFAFVLFGFFLDDILEDNSNES